MATLSGTVADPYTTCVCIRNAAYAIPPKISLANMASAEKTGNVPRIPALVPLGLVIAR